MKIFKIALLSMMILTGIVSCTKDSDSPSTNPSALEGLWVGAYGYDNDNPSISYRFDIKPGGIIHEVNSSGQSKGSGTWKLEGNIFTAKYTWNPPLGTTFSVIATYDASKKKLLGNWGWGNSATDGGLWSMTKSN